MPNLQDTLRVTTGMESWFVYPWIAPVVFIVAGLVLGLVFERIVLVWLQKLAARTHFRGDDVVVQGIRGLTTLWFLLLGLYGALLNMSLSAPVFTTGRKILLVTFIISLTIAGAKIATRLVTMAGAGAESENVKTASILRIVARILVFTIGALIVLQSLGITITPMLTALGVGGLAVALALQPTLANLFAGIQIIAAREIKPGDFIRLQSGEEGYVEDITWRNTTIRQLANNMIIVPNDKLATTIVTNFHSPAREMSVVIPVSVAYGSDLKQVERVAIEEGRQVQQEVQGAVRGHEPFIRYNEFADSGVKFSVILRANEYTDQYLMRHEFIRRLHFRFAAEGIVIPFPTRTVKVEYPADRQG